MFNALIQLFDFMFGMAELSCGKAELHGKHGKSTPTCSVKNRQLVVAKMLVQPQKKQPTRLTHYIYIYLSLQFYDASEGSQHLESAESIARSLSVDKLQLLRLVRSFRR